MSRCCSTSSLANGLWSHDRDVSLPFAGRRRAGSSSQRKSRLCGRTPSPVWNENRRISFHREEETVSSRLSAVLRLDRVLHRDQQKHGAQRCSVSAPQLRRAGLPAWSSPALPGPLRCERRVRLHAEANASRSRQHAVCGLQVTSDPLTSLICTGWMTQPTARWSFSSSWTSSEDQTTRSTWLPLETPR